MIPPKNWQRYSSNISETHIPDHSSRCPTTLIIYLAGMQCSWTMSVLFSCSFSKKVCLPSHVMYSPKAIATQSPLLATLAHPLHIQFGQRSVSFWLKNFLSQQLLCIVIYIRNNRRGWTHASPLTTVVSFLVKQLNLILSPLKYSPLAVQEVRGQERCLNPLTWTVPVALRFSRDRSSTVLAAVASGGAGAGEAMARRGRRVRMAVVGNCMFTCGFLKDVWRMFEKVSVLDCDEVR